MDVDIQRLNIILTLKTTEEKNEMIVQLMQQ
jgi:hypothetical protein